MTERICHICGTRCAENCPTCTANFPSRKSAGKMTLDERLAEFDLLGGILEFDFSLLHKRMEELIGRTVWTHEFAKPEQLRAEMISGQRASIENVIEKLASYGKPTIIILNPEAKR